VSFNGSERIADLINFGIIILLIISFVYVVFDRFISDATLFDLINLPASDPRKLTYYVEPSQSVNDPLPFSSLFGPPEVYVTLVIPILNEESWLPTVLADAIWYLTLRQTNEASFSWEIIVADDGSRDRSPDIAIDFGHQNRNVRLLRQPRAMGKGATVQAGCLHARGELIWVMTPECAAKLREFDQLETTFLNLRASERNVVVVAGRGGADTGGSNFLRTVLNFLMPLTGVANVRDTQCGLKLFSPEAARWLFPNQHITG
jgi:dolichyl-phosphate beta-glucosyltransferase